MSELEILQEIATVDDINPEALPYMQVKALYEIALQLNRLCFEVIRRGEESGQMKEPKPKPTSPDR